MLKLFTLLIAMLCFGSCAIANVFRINSNLTTSASQKLYKTIQEANNASVVLAGDTLMIEGSPLEYSSATLNKKLVLIGTGYFLVQNPQTQASQLQSVVQTITLQSGASGSILIGLTFSSNYSGYTPYIQGDNMLITRCFLPFPIYINASVNNIQINQNYFVSSALEVNYSGYAFTGISFKNNLVGAYANASINITSDNSYPRIFSSVENNIFRGNITLTTSIFRSNIVVSPTSTVSVTSANIQNNLVRNTGQLPATNGNIGYDSASLFVGPTTNSTDGQYKLKLGSPYLTAGYANTQPGIFGGTQSYVLSGLPPIPSIYGFTADGIANKQIGLPINIKVKANQ